MSEPNALERLFTNKVSREQFKENYMQIRTERSDGDEYSIFESDMTYSLDDVYDILDFNHDNKIDDDELNDFKNYDTSDGTNVLSDSDFQILYDKTIEKILSKYKNQTPEHLYDNAVNKGGVKPSIIGESPKTAYKSQLAVQTDALQELMRARRQQSFNKITRFQNELDNLILKYSNLSKEEKNIYKTTSAKILKKRKEIAEKENKLESLKEKLKLKENETAHKKNNDQANNGLESKCNELSKEISELKTELNQLLITQKTLVQKVGGTRSDFNSNKRELERKIKLEQSDYENDMKNYNIQLDVLNNAHLYAVQHDRNNEVISDYSDSDTKNFSGDAKELKKIWGGTHKNLSDGFYNKVIEISNRVGCDANALMAVMQAESGISTTARNKKSGATGLIQFMPKTARLLGTSTEALSKMSPEQQLVFVEKYLNMNKKMVGFKSNEKINQVQLYALVFSPKYARRGMNDVLYSKGSTAYKWNEGLDKNKKGYIVMADLNNALERHKPKSIRRA